MELGRNFLSSKLPFVFFMLIVGLVASIAVVKINKKSNSFVKTPDAEKKVLGTFVLSPTVTQIPTATPTPINNLETRKIRLGLVVDDYTNESGQMLEREKELGVKISTISIFKQFGLPYNNHLANSDLMHIKNANKNLLLAWEPWNPQEGKNQATDYLREIGEGKHDEYIKSFASDIKSYGGKVSLRFGHEMNGDWYPWGQRPEEYKNAYRRIYEIFKNEGVTNVTWMWSINASPVNEISSFYPGNEYVDVIGIDGFNFGSSQSGHTWVTFGQIFSKPYNIVLSYGKPIQISEVASTEIGGEKEVWIRQMFETLNTSLTKIEEIIWFDINKETDWRISSSSKSLYTFKESL